MRLKPGGRFAAIVYSTPDKNQFFSIPVGIIRRRAKLPPPQPGQPGPFSLGGDGVLAAAYERAGLRDIEVRKVDSPVRLPSAAECVRFERESFGALHQMMSTLSEAERAETWDEIERELRQFETTERVRRSVRNDCGCRYGVDVATRKNADRCRV